MLGNLREPDGRPRVRTRLIALLAAVGLLGLSAPAIIPVVRWLAGLVW
jgi:hypothetical protein